MTLTNDQWQEAIVQLANSGISIGATSDTFGNAATITAATTFSGVPTISQLAANSSALLANPGDQATFIAEIAVASAFVGTISFYGLAPDGATLQLIGAHLRGVGTTANSTAINTGVALNQVWMGSIADFKSVYVVCTAFTSGSASVQLGLTAAPYALAILNTPSVSVSNANANGQSNMAGSQPVAIASDQSAIPVKRPGKLLYSTTQTGISATANSGNLDVSGYDGVLLICNITAINGTSVQIRARAVDNFGTLTSIGSIAAQTSNGAANASVGRGCQTVTELGTTIVIEWLCTAITSVSFQLTVYVK